MNKKNKMWVRAMAWILAGLMVLGAIYIGISAIVENAHEHTHQEEDEHAGHNH
jgi:hypothetical protein